MDARRSLLVFFLVSLGAAAAIGVIALLFDLPSQDRIIGSASLVAAYSVTGLACAAMLARRRQRVACWLSLGAQVLSLLGWLILIWFEDVIGWPRTNQWARTCATLSLFGASALHVALLGLLTLKGTPGRIGRIASFVLINGALTIAVYFFWAELLDWTRYLPFLTVRLISFPFVLVVLGVLLIVSRRSRVARVMFLALGVWTYLYSFILISEVDVDDDILWRLFGGLLIAGLFCTFATPLCAYLEHLSRKRTDDATMDQFVAVQLTCPKCAGAITVHANRHDTCPTCGLQVHVGITEPRCDCGYLLTGIAGERCPECGRPVSEANRWKTQEPVNEPPDPG